jgi:hypothetical protein
MPSGEREVSRFHTLRNARFVSRVIIALAMLTHTLKRASNASVRANARILPNASNRWAPLIERSPDYCALRMAAASASNVPGK